MARQLDRLKRMSLVADGDLTIADSELEEMYDLCTKIHYDVALRLLKDPRWQFPDYILAWDITIPISGTYTFDPVLSTVVFTDGLSRTSVIVDEARATDINLAASLVWERKAGRLYNAVDWSSDNHSVKASQEYLFCQQQAAYYRSLSTLGALKSVPIVRSDLV